MDALLGNLKYKVRRNEGTRPVITGSTGSSISEDGTVAQVEQHVDRETKRYRKRVVAQDGTIIKDYDGPIDGGHGGPPLKQARRKAKRRQRVAWLLKVAKKRATVK